MLQTTMNIFDLGVLVIIGMSALLSFFRGFVREVLSLGTWIGAAVITLYSFPTVAKWIEPQVHNPMIASGLASMGVFLITLVLLSIISGLFVKFLKPGTEVGALDNFIGLAFGTARGVLLVAVGYFIMTLVVAEGNYPEWVNQAASRPYVAKAAHWVAKAAPDYLDEVTGNSRDKDDEKPVIRSKKTATKAQVKRAEETLDDQSDNLPSFEDLQRRVRAENTDK